MTPDIFSCAISDAGRMCRNRHIPQIAIDVGGQFQRRRIALIAVLFERLQNDAIEVSTYLSNQHPRLILTLVSKFGQRNCVPFADLRAGLERITFAQLPQYFVKRLLVPLAHIERLVASEQNVEDHA